MKIIICGSRTININHKTKVYAVLDRLHAEHEFTEVIVGRAKGADTIGEMWARERGIEVKPFPAQWKKPDGTTNRAAGYQRNSVMIAQEPELVIALIDKPLAESRGTNDTINKAKAKGIPTRVFRTEPIAPPVTRGRKGITYRYTKSANRFYGM